MIRRIAMSAWWTERMDRLALLCWAAKGGRWPRWVDADRRRRLQQHAAEIDHDVRNGRIWR